MLRARYYSPKSAFFHILPLAKLLHGKYRVISSTCVQDIRDSLRVFSFTCVQDITHLIQVFSFTCVQDITALLTAKVLRSYDLQCYVPSRTFYIIERVCNIGFIPILAFENICLLLFIPMNFVHLDIYLA